MSQRVLLCWNPSEPTKGNSKPPACAHRKEPQRAESHSPVRAHFRARDILPARAWLRARTSLLSSQIVAKNLRGNIAPAGERHHGAPAAEAAESALRSAGNTNLRGICLPEPSSQDHGGWRRSAEC